MGTSYDTRHGGPYDRGSADAYYGRARSPHYFTGATYDSPKVTRLTAKERAAYNAGFDDMLASGARKDWG